MKAFLMFRDRDFDSQQLLSRRDRESRYRNTNNQELALEQLLPWNQAALRQDLGLDFVCKAMSLDDKFLFEVARVALLSSLIDVDTIIYRQDILSDSLNNPQIIRDIYQLAVEAIESERKAYWSSYSRSASLTLHSAVEVMLLFLTMLKRLRRIVDQYSLKFASEGFSRLFAMLKQELNDEFFAVVEQHLQQLKFRRGVLVSAHLGPGNKGRSYVLRRPHQDTRSWLTRLLAEKPLAHSFELHPRDEAGHRALSELRDRGINLVANALAQSADHILSFFQMLRAELAFYVGCLNLHVQMQKLGEPACRPVPAPSGQRKLSFLGLYDLSLALTGRQKVVGNDVDADGKDVAIVTGANTGGKSTFLRSVGLAQLMTQSGMFVPARSFSAEVCDGVFTHYKREEDVAMESGKWDEELSRMSDIVSHLRPNAIVLFNESFASTNEREGSEIATQIVAALLDSGVKVLFVTHLYHFARGVCDLKKYNAIFLRAERRPDGTRPFKLIEAEPLQTSYGEDLYKTIFGRDDPTLPRNERAISAVP